MPEITDVYIKDAGKILKEILKPGHGELVPIGTIVTVHYTGTLLDGTIFDSSRDRSGTFKFNVGVGEVIPGWDIGICSMKKGEHAILTIHPEYGYGSEGNPPKIKPDVTLKYDVEILDWEYQDVSREKNRSFEKRLVTVGMGYLSPVEGEFVEVHICVKWNSKVLEDRELIFRMGDGKDHNIPQAIEWALGTFKSGEQSRILISPKHCVYVSYLEELDNPDTLDTPVEYDIKLRRFERLLVPWSMDEDDKIELSEMFKRSGNQYIKENKYAKSIGMYEKVLENLIGKDGELIKSDEHCTKLLLSIHLNLSLAYLKTNKYESARDSALKALGLDPDNDKAHYRYALALLNLSDHEKAKHHFEICLKIDPNNSRARDLLSQSKEGMVKRAEDERKCYQNMFKKFAEMDAGKEKQANKN
ncbi:peptidyl-prolyl cis-trans isomerase FKBP4-like [Coccinella septempunctata]|uniref:peptidyl-prolyl cis-trans isomerase FKBP4-like n=1 Tax=Coccinella septempunctata TaxID=41139 RepID=UPI001D07C255|nr:peptidyl-prolyl cis-trans isomerase FKBP4-like [Coccinella septempunctata]